MKQQGYITVNHVSNEIKGLDRLTISSHPIESSGLLAPVANLSARGEESVNASVSALLARAFGHSEPAARKARLIAVAFEQLPHKTPLDRPRELAKIDQDVRALSEMMGVRS